MDRLKMPDNFQPVATNRNFVFANSGVAATPVRLKTCRLSELQLPRSALRLFAIQVALCIRRARSRCIRLVADAMGPCVIARQGDASGGTALNGKQHTVITLRSALVEFVEISNHSAVLGRSSVKGRRASRFPVAEHVPVVRRTYPPTVHTPLTAAPGKKMPALSARVPHM